MQHVAMGPAWVVLHAHWGTGQQWKTAACTGSKGVVEGCQHMLQEQ